MTLPDILESGEVAALIDLALAEDIREGDVTTAALVPDSVFATGTILSRGDYVVAGGMVAAAVFPSSRPAKSNIFSICARYASRIPSERSPSLLPISSPP